MTSFCIDFQDESINVDAIKAILSFPNWRELLEQYFESLGVCQCTCEEGYGYCYGYGE